MTDLCGDLCPACHLTCERVKDHNERPHAHDFDFTSRGQSNLVKRVKVTHEWEVVQ